MTRGLLGLLLTLLSVLGPVDQSRAQGADNPLLAPAETLASTSHLILTVPMTDNDTLATTARTIEQRFGVTLAAEWPLRSINVHCFVVRVAANSNVDSLITRMEGDTLIRTVQRIRDFQTYEAPHYSDPLLPAQTALTEINAMAAQRLSMGSGIKIGVVDSTIDRDHPDLLGRVDSLRDFVATGRREHAEAHGTAIAGIVAADAENAVGMVGIAPRAELIGLRACWQNAGEPGRCNSFSLARALNFAVLNDIPIINMSLGGPRDPLLAELVEAAIKKGILIVAARGEGETAAFPASMSEVIGAGLGDDHCIPAPSIDVISTAPDEGYRYVSGSSVATAHVTGVAALLLSARPDLKPKDIERALRDAVKQRSSGPMLDACQALRSVTGDTLDCSPP
jgi:subtilisin family serine protease